MKNVWNIALAVTVTFILNVALNFGINYLTEDNGTIAVGPSSTIQGKIYLPVAISNFNSSSLDDIVVSLPSSVIASEIIASDPIRVSEEPNNAGTVDRKQISISGIGHNRVLMLQIPLDNQDQVAMLEVMNARQKKLSVMPVKDIPYPLVRVLINALILSIIYALITVLYMIWEHARMTELNDRIQKAEETSEKAKQQLTEQQKKIEVDVTETKTTFNRVKIVMLARMADYSRELRFWRDTVRKVLYGLTGGPEAGEAIVKHVTASLHTYGTRTDYEADFETIKVLAGLIFNSESLGGKVSGGGS